MACDPHSALQAKAHWLACRASPSSLVIKEDPLEATQPLLPIHALVSLFWVHNAGKYTLDNLPGGARSLVINEDRVKAVQPLLSLMRDIGSAHGGKTCGQVSLAQLT